jgi:hypothetical protein
VHLEEMRNLFEKLKIPTAELFDEAVTEIGGLLQGSHEQLADARRVLSGHLVRVPKEKKAKCNNTRGV